MSELLDVIYNAYDAFVVMCYLGVLSHFILTDFAIVGWFYLHML